MGSHQRIENHQRIVSAIKSQILKLMSYIVIAKALCFAGVVSAQFSPASLPPVYDLLLSQTRLEQVLEAYADPASEHIFIAAHRGGKENDQADGAPGNSIANIANALSKGFDLYESDIEILGDGTLIVFHDDHFNDLTNSVVPDDLLDNADIAYAKTLFLTYDNDVVSGERIPTLAEFLSAAKGKIMVKFDLKTGTFGSSVLQEIFDTVVNTGTVEQVLIRGGANVLDVAKTNLYDTRMIMRRYNTAPSVQDINDLVANYDVRAISIPNGADSMVVDAANLAGLVVEIHELGPTNELPTEWSDAIADGFRQVHSFKPSLLLAYLQANNHRAF